jgi:hypothetical protein
MPKNTIKEPQQHDCCYYQCPEPGTIHLKNANPDNKWICRNHFDKWHADRARSSRTGFCATWEL